MSVLLKSAMAASAARALIGAAMIARPAKIGESWIGEAGRYERVTVLTRAVGARDIGLGVLAVAGLASENEDLARGSLLAGCLCDTTDLLAMVAVRDKLPAASFARIGPLAAAFALLSGAAAVATARS